MKIEINVTELRRQRQNYMAARERMERAAKEIEAANAELAAKKAAAQAAAEEERRRLMMPENLLKLYRETFSSVTRRSPMAIAKSIAAKHKVRVNDMLGAGRARVLCEARFETYYEVKRQRPDMSLPQIGRLVGDRDHTTVLHGIARWAKLNNLPLPYQRKTDAPPVYFRKASAVPNGSHNQHTRSEA